MNSNFEYYKIFYYVAKYENLTKAATVLKTSQPAVTRTIHKLENELGCRLFTRSKTGMQLTPEGRTFYGYVAAGCAQFFKGENDLSNLISLENGTIYISATETALHCYLFQAMEEFNSLYPNVRFKILNNSTTESVNAVKEGKVDLAFVSANLQVAKPLRMKILRKYHDILISGNRFGELKDDGKEVSLKELVSYPWISLTAETITRRFLNEYFEKNSLTFTPDMELATTDMILPAVKHNLGLGFMPHEEGHAAALPLTEIVSKLCTLVEHNPDAFERIVEQSYTTALGSLDEECAFRNEIALLSVSSAVLCWALKLLKQPDSAQTTHEVCQAYINNCLSEWDSSLDCNAKEILHKALFSASEAGDIRFIRYEEVDSSYDPERDIVQKKDAFLLKGSLLKSLLHEYAPGYSASDVISRLQSEHLLSEFSSAKKIRINSGTYVDARLLTLKSSCLTEYEDSD